MIRPIAFKPVPYKCNTPNYGAPIGGRLTELSDRYGSTPSLGPTMSLQYKFGSTTDLHHLQQQQQGSSGSSGSNGATPIASVGPCSSSGSMGGASFSTFGGSMMSNSYHQHYPHQYSTLMRKGGSSTIPFKTYDSLESILKLPDSMMASYPNPSHGYVFNLSLFTTPRSVCNVHVHSVTFLFSLTRFLAACTINRMSSIWHHHHRTRVYPN